MSPVMQIRFLQTWYIDSVLAATWGISNADLSMTASSNKWDLFRVGFTLRYVTCARISETDNGGLAGGWSNASHMDSLDWAVAF